METEELFDEVSLGNQYMDTEEGSDLLEVPTGENKDPEKPELPEEPEEPGKGTKGEGDTGKKDKKSEGKTGLEDLIDTNNVDKHDKDDGLDDDPDEEEDSDKKTKDSDEDSPDSPNDDDKDSSPSASVDPFVAFGNTLKERGSFATFNEEEFKKLAKEKGDPEEAFVEMQKNELEKSKEEYINGLTDEDRELYEAKEYGVNLNEIGQIDKTLKSYSQITDEQLESEDNTKTARSIAKEYLKLRGFDDEEAEETVELYEEKGTLGSKSKKARDEIVKSLKGQKTQIVEDKKQEQKANQDRIDTQKKELQKTVNNFKEIIPGIDLNEATKKEIYKDLTTPVAEDENGKPVDALSFQRNKNPQAFDAVITYMNKLGFLNFDDDGNYKPDFSKIKTTAETKEAKRLGKILNSNESFRPNSKKGKKKDTESIYDTF